MPKKIFQPTDIKAFLAGELNVTAKNKIIIAFSGGLDSTVLLCALKKADPPCPIIAVHVHHGLSPRAADWVAHCRNICAELDVPLHIETIEVPRNTGKGLEAAARALRYDAMAKYIDAQTILLTAHHKDDQAETVLLQLLRGTGPAGMAAMPRSTTFAGGRHARPLLDFTRTQLQHYAEAQELQWIEDPSNQSLELHRNVIRQKVMPLVKQYWQHATQTLARGAAHAANTRRLLHDLAAIDLARIDMDSQSLAITDLNNLDSLRRANVLRYWLTQRGILSPSQKKINEVLAGLDQPTRTGKCIISTATHEFGIYGGRLYFTIKLPPVDPSWETEWHPKQPLAVPTLGWVLKLKLNTPKGIAQKWLEHAPWQIKLRTGGERILLPGHKQHSLLKNLLQEARIPPWRRERLPLIYIQDRLAAVANLWFSAEFAAKTGEKACAMSIKY